MRQSWSLDRNPLSAVRIIDYERGTMLLGFPMDSRSASGARSTGETM